MAGIAVGDVTITVVKNRLVRASPGSILRNTVKIQFGDGALTYPALGVPLPTYPKFGMKRELEYLILLDNGSAVTILWRYDFANKKLRGWLDDAVTGISAELGAVTVAAQTLYAEAVGW